MAFEDDFNTYNTINIDQLMISFIELFSNDIGNKHYKVIK
jgi:hypothetical protein